MKTLKTKMLFFALLFATSFAVKAQEASGGYEYAEVTVGFSGEWKIVALYSDKEREVIETGFKTIKDFNVSEALIKEIGNKAKQGWQVVNVVSLEHSFVPSYFLRRKKQ